MRRALAAVGLLASVAVLGAFGGSAGSVSDAAACGTSMFSTGGARCRAHEGTGVQSRTLHCSARVDGLAGQPYTGTFTYRGRSFPAQTGTIPGDGYVYTTLTIAGGEFPAGRWRCEIEAGGSKASVSFATDGPRTRLSSAAACPTAQTVESSSVRACRLDGSRLPFAPTSKITCSGVYSLAAGRRASAHLLYEGKPTGLSLTRSLTLPVSVFGMQVSKKGGLPSGDYACVFSLGGKKLSTKTFSIAPAA